MVTQEELKELLHYDPITGIFVWIANTGTVDRIGRVAGFVHGKYRRIKIRGEIYKAHRLAILYMTGSFPKEEVDHKVGSSNAISNIRDVSHSTNMQNQTLPHSNNKLGVLGVSVYKNHYKDIRYKAQIKVRGKVVSLGYFLSIEEASLAYQEAKKIYHAEAVLSP